VLLFQHLYGASLIILYNEPTNAQLIDKLLYAPTRFDTIVSFLCVVDPCILV